MALIKWWACATINRAYKQGHVFSECSAQSVLTYIDDPLKFSLISVFKNPRRWNRQTEVHFVLILLPAIGRGSTDQK